MTTYRIVVEGEISDRFFATFGGMRVDHQVGETWMTGEIADQAQLQGVIAHIADLGLALRSVGPVADDAEVASGARTPRDVGPDSVDGGRDDRLADRKRRTEVD